MKTLSGLIFLIVSALLVLPAATHAAEKLDNAAVIELHKLGLGDAVIVEKIKTSPTAFKTGVDDLKALKSAGISDEVLKAMISAGAPAPAPAPEAAKTAGKAAVAGDPNDPHAAHPSGIYLYQERDGQRKMTRLDASGFEGMKSGAGWGVAWGGTAKTRAVLTGTKASLQIEGGQPVFYFYFDEAETGLSSTEKTATKPDDFALTALEIRETKSTAERRLVIGKTSLGGSKFGLDSKAVRPIQSERIADGVYKVWPTTALAPGEYGFVYGGTGNMGGPSKVFDFGIR